MKLSDVMSAAGLAGYAELGLCLFLLVFISVAIRTFQKGRSHEYEELGQLPLMADDTLAKTTNSASTQG